MNSLFFKLSLILADAEIPDPSAGIDYINGWISMFFTFFGGIATGWMGFLLIKSGIKLAHEEDPTMKKQHLVQFVWTIVGFLIALAGLTIASVFTGMLYKG